MYTLEEMVAPPRHDHDICGAKTKEGHLCRQPAGKGTIHFGEGRCSLHSGRREGARPKVMLESIHPELRSRVFELLRDPDLLDMRKELAMLKARMELLEVDQEEDSDVSKMVRLTAQIRQMTKAIDEIERGRHHYVHMTVTSTMVAAFVDIAKQYIPEETRRRFTEDVENAIKASMRGNTSYAIAARAMNPLEERVVIE